MNLTRNFTRDELACKHTGRCEMHPAFLDRLQRLRDAYGKPMRITSGYRDPSHPVERNKTTTGAHSLGRAVDVAVSGEDRYHLVRLAMAEGFTGIGVASTFIHLDDVTVELPRPRIWSYT